MRANGTCKSCEAPIRWAVFEDKPGAFPLDPFPTVDGNISVVDWRPATNTRAIATPVCAIKPGPRAVTSYRYTSHFATCPDANEHRKPRKTAPKRGRPKQ